MKKLLEELKRIRYVGIINIRKDRETLEKAIKLIEAYPKIEKDLAHAGEHLDEVRGYSGFWGGIIYARKVMAKHLKECGIKEEV